MMRTLALIAVATLGTITTTARAADPTYAERLGWKRGRSRRHHPRRRRRMSHDSNVGALRSVREGVASRSA